MTEITQTSWHDFRPKAELTRMSETISWVNGYLTHVSTFTEQSTCILRKRKSGFTELLRRAEGGLYRQRKGKIPLLILFWAEIQPFNFFNPKQMKQNRKKTLLFFWRNTDEYWFYGVLEIRENALIVSDNSS